VGENLETTSYIIDQPSWTEVDDTSHLMLDETDFFDNNTIFPSSGDIHIEGQTPGTTPINHQPSAETSSRPKRGLGQPHMSREDVENRSTEGSVPRPVIKKPRCSANSTELQYSIQLSEYVTFEERRCQALGIPFYETDIGSAIRPSNMPLKNCDLITLKTIYFAIGSSESLVALQEVLKARRIAGYNKIPEEGRTLSLADRIRAIEGIGSNIAYFVLQRRYHIYQLFFDSSVGSRRTSDGFVINTTQSISKQVRPRIGNPNNLEDSRITEEILKELHPGLQPDTDIYQKKRRFVRNLRKLGERFDMLVNTFGYAILGLLSWPGGELLDVPAVSVTDELYVLNYFILVTSLILFRILSLSDSVFKSFVLHLKQAQGDYLCAASSAVANIVTALFQDTLDSLTTFPLEQVEPAKILKFPKGSQELLYLIS
jgi:hypothetical protein